MEFTPDKRVQGASENYAAQAVACAKNTFQIHLDLSDESIKDVGSILDRIHQQAIKDKPTYEELFEFARAFGSYIGEVYRKNHGAEWGLLTWDGEVFPGLKCKDGGGIFWPWGKAQGRIQDGDENNVWDYYQSLVN